MEFKKSCFVIMLCCLTTLAHTSPVTLRRQQSGEIVAQTPTKSMSVDAHMSLEQLAQQLSCDGTKVVSFSQNLTHGLSPKISVGDLIAQPDDTEATLHLYASTEQLPLTEEEYKAHQFNRHISGMIEQDAAKIIGNHKIDYAIVFQRLLNMSNTETISTDELNKLKTTYARYLTGYSHLIRTSDTLRHFIRKECNAYVQKLKSSDDAQEIDLVQLFVLQLLLSECNDFSQIDVSIIQQQNGLEVKFPILFKQTHSLVRELRQLAHDESQEEARHDEREQAYSTFLEQLEHNKMLALMSATAGAAVCYGVTRAAQSQRCYDLYRRCMGYKKMSPEILQKMSEKARSLQAMHKHGTISTNRLEKELWYLTRDYSIESRQLIK